MLVLVCDTCLNVLEWACMRGLECAYIRGPSGTVWVRPDELDACERACDDGILELERVMSLSDPRMTRAVVSIACDGGKQRSKLFSSLMAPCFSSYCVCLFVCLFVF